MSWTSTTASTLNETEQNKFNELILHGQFPAATPPPGVKSNLINPEWIGWLGYMTACISLPILTSLIVIRIYTKRWVNKFGMDWSDWTIVLAFVIELSYCALGMRGAYYGGGTHQWNLTAERAIHVARIANVAEIMYNPAAFFTKLSITLQILRIFGGRHRGAVYWICHVTIWFNLLFQSAMMFVAIFHCQPQRKYWMPWIPGKCLAPGPPLMVSAIVSTVTDLVLFVTPIVCTWRLQMSRRQKWGVSAVFATAFFAVFCSIMRIASTVTFIRAGENDSTWGFVGLALWTFGEIGSGIASSCMAVLPQFIRHIYPKLRKVLGLVTLGQLSSSKESPKQSRNHVPSPAPRGFWSKGSTQVATNETAGSELDPWPKKDKDKEIDWETGDKPADNKRPPLNPLTSNPLTQPASQASSRPSSPGRPPPVPPKDSWYQSGSSGSSLEIEEETPKTREALSPV